MASAWLRSAQERRPMATSSSFSFSPARHALLRLRTCRHQRDCQSEGAFIKTGPAGLRQAGDIPDLDTRTF